MAGPYLVPCTKPLKCPSDEKLYVKHVVLNKENDPRGQVKEVENSLMINQLFTDGRKQSVWDKLLTVEFSSYSEDEIKGILSRDIEFDGSQYCFLGFSESQLRNKTCFLIKETEKQIRDRRAKFGNFRNDIPFANRAATVQHMFEPFEKSLQLAEGEFKFEHHPSNNVPSGFMSPELAETIKKTCSLAKPPSVVQVICPGFSGKLVLSDEICGRTSEDSFPSSRIKALFKLPDAAINCGNSLTMGVVDYVKPYNMGYLNVYTVMFLKEMGVTRDYFLKLQRDYYEVLEKVGAADLTFVKYFLRQNGREDLLRAIGNEITNDAKGKIYEIKDDEIESMKNGTEPELRVLVSMSREVFGVEDPYKELKSGECVFVPCVDCLNDREKELFYSAKQVLVIPQPCFTSTDIQVLKLVRDKEEYENLEDCLVLPSQPEAQVSVANKYFVCWDINLMPQKSDSFLDLIANVWPVLCGQILKTLPAFSSLPCSREKTPTRHSFEGFEEMKTSQRDRKVASKLHENGSFQDELKEYFATFKSNDGLVSRAKSLFEAFAALRGPSCSECKKLGGYLSPSFDWNAKRNEAENYLAKLDEKYEKISPDLESTQDSPVATQSSTPQPVWREMTEILREFIAQNT